MKRSGGEFGKILKYPGRKKQKHIESANEDLEVESVVWMRNTLHLTIEKKNALHLPMGGGGV